MVRGPQRQARIEEGTRQDTGRCQLNERPQRRTHEETNKQKKAEEKPRERPDRAEDTICRFPNKNKQKTKEKSRGTCGGRLSP